MKDDGFTLLEVLIVLGLTAVCLTTVGALLGVSMRATADARDETAATLLARQKVDALRSTPFALTGTSAGSVDENVGGYFDVIDEAGRSYAASGNAPFSSVFLRRWAVATEVAGGVAAELVSVRVLRVWSADGPPRGAVGARLATMRLPR